MFRFIFSGIIGFCFTVFFLNFLYAANMTIMPVSLRFEPPKFSDTVVIRNEGRSPLKLQFRLYRWEQKKGKDVYFPTKEVLVTPSFLTIKAGGDGTVRVGRFSKNPIVALESYRLIIDELPASRVRRSVTAMQVGVEIVTRHILPVLFAAGSESRSRSVVSSSLRFSAQEQKGGYLITVENKSADVIKFGKGFLLANNKEIGQFHTVVGNVLPRSNFSFFVAAKGGGRPHKIRIDENGVVKEYPLL